MSNWITRLKDTEQGRALLEQERVLLETTERICQLMDQQQVTKSELARRLGTSQANVSKLLHGSQNFTLRTLSDIYFWLGRSLHVYDAHVGDLTRVPDEYTHVTHGIKADWGPRREPIPFSQSLSAASPSDGLAA